MTLNLILNKKGWTAEEKDQYKTRRKVERAEDIQARVAPDAMEQKYLKILPPWMEETYY